MNTPTKGQIQTPRSTQQELAGLIRAGRAAWRQGLINGWSGNLSLRSHQEMLITCSGVCKGRLQAQDVIRVDLRTGQARGPGSMSSEAGMHTMIYRQQADARAVVHVHPIHVLALDQAEAPLCDLSLFEADVVREQLTSVPALAPGSSDLARAVGQAATTHRAILLTRHGLVCWGESWDRALSLAEEVEALARIQVLAAQVRP